MLISQVQAIPIFNFMKSNESPKSIKLRCDFTADTLYEVLLTQERQLAKFETARSIYFDASNCANDVHFECLETGQRITFKAGKQGYRNVLISMGMRFRLTGTSPDVFLGNLLNVDMPESEWPLDTSIPDSIPLSSLAYAAAQYDVIGRKTAGAGAWEDCTRQQLNIAGTDLANTFSQGQVITSTVAAASLSIYSSGGAASIGLTGDNQQATLNFTRYQNSTNAVPIFRFRKFRGTEAAPTANANNDGLGNVTCQGYDGTQAVTVSNDTVFMNQAAAVGAMGARRVIELNANGSATPTEIMRLDHTNGWQAFGANTVIDANRLMKRRPFTFATLPAAAVSQDGFAVITDGAAAPAWNAAAAGGGAVRTPVWSTGAAWQNG